MLNGYQEQTNIKFTLVPTELKSPTNSVRYFDMMFPVDLQPWEIQTYKIEEKQATNPILNMETEAVLNVEQSFELKQGDLKLTINFDIEMKSTGDITLSTDNASFDPQTL